jgi:hypothetical protein
MYGSEVGRTAWVRLQLVTEFHDVIVDATAARVAVSVAANLLQQFCACDDAVWVLNEKLQSLELMCRQLDRRAVSGHLDLPEVDHNVIESDLTRSRAKLGVTQRDPQPCQ